MGITLESAATQFAERIAQACFDARNGRIYLAGKAVGEAERHLYALRSRETQDRALRLLHATHEALRGA
jgi:hypothetical protein